MGESLLLAADEGKMEMEMPRINPIHGSDHGAIDTSGVEDADQLHEWPRPDKNEGVEIRTWTNGDGDEISETEKDRADAVVAFGAVIEHKRYHGFSWHCGRNEEIVAGGAVELQSDAEFLKSCGGEMTEADLKDGKERAVFKSVNEEQLRVNGRCHPQLKLPKRRLIVKEITYVIGLLLLLVYLCSLGAIDANIFPISVGALFAIFACLIIAKQNGYPISLRTRIPDQTQKRQIRKLWYTGSLYAYPQCASCKRLQDRYFEEKENQIQEEIRVELEKQFNDTCEDSIYSLLFHRNTEKLGTMEHELEEGRAYRGCWIVVGVLVFQAALLVGVVGVGVVAEDLSTRRNSWIDNQDTYSSYHQNVTSTLSQHYLDDIYEWLHVLFLMEFFLFIWQLSEFQCTARAIELLQFNYECHGKSRPGNWSDLVLFRRWPSKEELTWVAIGLKCFIDIGIVLGNLILLVATAFSDGGTFFDAFLNALTLLIVADVDDRFGGWWAHRETRRRSGVTEEKELYLSAKKGHEKEKRAARR